MTRNVKSGLSLLIFFCLGFSHAFAQQTDPVLTHFYYQLTWQGLRLDVDLYAPDAQVAAQFKQTIQLKLKQADRDWLQLQQRMHQAQQKMIPIAEAELELFQTLQQACLDSRGAFDVTDYVLRQLWGFTPESLAYKLPSTAKIDGALQQMGCQKFEIDALPPRLFFKQAPTHLHTDAFRRGWLLDQVAPELHKTAVPAFELRIDQVGYYHGAPPGAQAWKIRWFHPRDTQRTLTALYAKNQAVVLVGDHQDYFLQNGIRYSSLLDGRTGFPNTENIAVQAMAPSALQAELIARAVAVLNEAETRAFLKTRTGSVYKIIERNGMMLPRKY